MKSHTTEKDIKVMLAACKSVEEINNSYASIKESDLSFLAKKEEFFKLLTELNYEFCNLTETRNSMSAIDSTYKNKELNIAIAKRRTFLLRVIKQITFNWLGNRETAVAKKDKAQRFLKEELIEKVGDSIPEIQITHLLYETKLTYQRKRRDNLPLLRIERLLKSEEGTRVEVKKSLSLLEPIAKTISAFCNTKGGVIIIGLAEKAKEENEVSESLIIAGEYVLVGLFRNLDQHRARLMQFLGDNLSVDIDTLEVELLHIEKYKLMIIEVPSIRIKQGELVFFKDDLFIREDNHNRRLTSKETYKLVNKM